MFMDVFKDLRRVSKKNWRKLESQAGKCMRTKPKVGIKKKPDSAFLRTLPTS